MLKSNVLKQAFNGAAWLIVSWQLLIWLPTMIRTHRCLPGMDVECYYGAFRSLSRGQVPYVPFHHGPDVSPGGCLYSPPFVVLGAPLGHFSPAHFSIFWTILTVCAFWGFAYCVALLARGNRPTLQQVVNWGAVAWICPNVVHAMTWGQFDPVMWLAVTAAIIWDRTGVILAIAAIAKPYTLWPLAAEVVRTRRLSVMVIAAIALPVLAVGALGHSELYRYWLSWSLPKISQGTFNLQNASIPFAVLRALHGLRIWHYRSGLLPAGPHGFLLACSVIGPALAAWRTRNASREWRWSVLMLTAALFSPLCWFNYLALALPVAAVYLREHTTAPRLGWRRRPENAVVNMPTQEHDVCVVLR